MAGDLNIHEQAIVLTADASADAGALSAVEQVTGGVTHQYGQHVSLRSDGVQRRG